MSVNVKSKPIINKSCSEGYGAFGIARDVEIRDESPPSCDDIDICKLLTDIDLNIETPSYKNEIRESFVKKCEDSVFSLSSLLNEDILWLLENSTDDRNGKKPEAIAMPPCEVSLRSLAENYLKSEKKDDEILSNIEDDDCILPDIDLNFCIKKPDVNTKCFSFSPSSDTIDSGFDEEIACASPALTNFFNLKTEILQDTDFSSELKKSKPTLLSKSLVCKVKSDPLKRKKVESIKKELIKNHFRKRTHLYNEVEQVKSVPHFEDRSHLSVFNSFKCNKLNQSHILKIGFNQDSFQDKDF